MRIQELHFQPDRMYDLALVAGGYESRSQHLVSSGLKASLQYAFDLGFQQHPLVRATSALMSDHGYQTCSITSINDIQPAGAIRVAIDISALPRNVLAELVGYFGSAPRKGCTVDFFYSVGDFTDSKSLAEREHGISAGPLSSEHAGAIRSPNFPVGLVLGMGLEPSRAAGLVEILEPSTVWALAGSAGADRFKDLVDRAREELVSSNRSVISIDYDIRYIPPLVGLIQGLLTSGSHRMRMVLAPSGPKVLTLACLLAAHDFRGPRPAIWRVGSANPTSPIDVRAAGQVVGLRVVFD